MNAKSLLLVGLVVGLGSCSTAYRSGQTPDDVYYSPAPSSETYVVKNNSNERESYYYRNSEEREIRQAIRDPRYRSSISLGLGYGYNPYGYSPFGFNSFGFNSFGYNSFGYNPYSFYNYGLGFYNPYGGYNPYYGFNSYYSYNPYYPGYNFNPYYGNGHYNQGNYYPVPGRTITNTGPRKYNLGAYSPSGTTPRGMNNNTNSGRVNSSAAPVRSFNRTTPAPPAPIERRGVGNAIKRVFTPSADRTPSQSNNRRTFSNPPARSTQPSNNSRSMERPVNNTPPPSPARSFDPPSRSTPPPATNSGSSPVRTFKNN